MTRPAGTHPFERRSGRLSATGIVAIVTLLAGPLTGCGKKGDPLPPIRPIPAAAKDFQAIQRGDQLLLSFPYPRTTVAGTPLASVSEATVWQMQWNAPKGGQQQPLDARQFIAAARPERMLSTADLKAAVRGDRIALDMPIPTPEAQAETAPAGRPMVTLAVKTAGPTGEESGLSNLVTLAIQEAPAPPTGLAIAAEAQGVRLRWEYPEMPEAAPDETDAATMDAESTESSVASTDASAPSEEPPAATAEQGEGEAMEASTMTDEGGKADKADGEEDEPGLAGFNVYRRLSTEHEYGAPVRTVGPKARDLLDESAVFGQRYIYTVTAVAARRPVLVESRFGEEVEIDYRDRFAPAAPTGVVALVQDRAQGGAPQVRVVWRPVEAADAAGYRVYRRSPASQEFQLVTPDLVTETALIDRDVTAGASYTYRVTAVDHDGNESEPSEQVTARVR